AAYNCGRCRKCVMTMVPLEAFGALKAVATFPGEIDPDLIDEYELGQELVLKLWQDIIDAAREASRPDLEAPVARLGDRTRRKLGLPADRTWRAPRDRDDEGPPRLDQRVRNVVARPGELSFVADIAGREQKVWFRIDADFTPSTDAALVAALMPA